MILDRRAADKKIQVNTFCRPACSRTTCGDAIPRGDTGTAGNSAKEIAPHRLLSEVEQLRLWNVCTITAEPGADIVLTVGDKSGTNVPPTQSDQPTPAPYRLGEQTGLRELRRKMVEVLDSGRFEILCADIEEQLAASGVTLRISPATLGGVYSNPPDCAGGMSTAIHIAKVWIRRFGCGHAAGADG